MVAQRPPQQAVGVAAVLARRARSRRNSRPSSAAIRGDVVDDRARPLGAAELAGVGVDHRLGVARTAPSGRAGTAGRRRRRRRRSRVVGERRRGPFEAGACRCSTTGRRRRTRPRSSTVGRRRRTMTYRHGATLGPYRPGAMTPSEPAADGAGDVLRHAGRRMGRAAASRHAVVAPGLAQHADGAGARRSRPSWRCTSSTTSGRRRSSPSASGSTGAPGAAAVHQRHRGGQLPPRGRRGRPVRRADARAHRRPAARAARCRRPADHRPDPPVRRLGAVVPRPGRPRRPPTQRLVARARRPRPSAAAASRPGAPQPAVPRAAGRHGRCAARRRRRTACRPSMRRPARPRTPTTPVRRRCCAARGVIVAGGRSGVTAEAVAALAAATRVAGARRPDVGLSTICRRRRGVRRGAARRRLRRRASPGRRRARRTAAGVEGARPVDRRQRRARRAGRRTRRRSTPTATSPVALDALPTAARGRRRRRPTGADGWVEAGAAAEAHIDRVLAQQPRAHRAGRRPHDRNGAAGRCRARGRLVDAGARPRVVRRPRRRGPTPTAAPTASTASMSTAIGVALARADRRSCCSATSPSCTTPER